MTAKQLFHAACNEAVAKLNRLAGRDGMSVEKVLNRLSIDQVLGIQHDLAEHFVVAIRNAADGVDVNMPATRLRDLIAREESARDITPRKPPRKLIKG